MLFTTLCLCQDDDFGDFFHKQRHQHRCNQIKKGLFGYFSKNLDVVNQCITFINLNHVLLYQNHNKTSIVHCSQYTLFINKHKNSFVRLHYTSQILELLCKSRKKGTVPKTIVIIWFIWTPWSLHKYINKRNKWSWDPVCYHQRSRKFKTCILRRVSHRETY